LEITEGVLVGDIEAAIKKMLLFKQHQIPLSIDDFGTGYSSLAYLRQFPIDKLKIDRTFVKEMETNETDHKMVKGIIELAHSLGLQTVAEGAENNEQIELLSELQCDIIQGYVYGAPVPAEKFQQYFDE